MLERYKITIFPRKRESITLPLLKRKTTRLSKLSQNLLKLTLLESEEYTPERATYRLDQQLKQIVLNSEPLWAEKEIELELNLEKVHITADQESMSQVWINLIHNSIKFTPNGGTITIQLKEYEKVVEVRIRDSGIGISKEQKQHIFERFYKADSSRNRAYGGSGLGLAIVKKSTRPSSRRNKKSRVRKGRVRNLLYVFLSIKRNSVRGISSNTIFLYTYIYHCCSYTDKLFLHYSYGMSNQILYLF